MLLADGSLADPGYAELMLVHRIALGLPTVITIERYRLAVLLELLQHALEGLPAAIGERHGPARVVLGNFEALDEAWLHEADPGWTPASEEKAERDRRARVTGRAASSTTS